jgi:hypothetical protein
MNCSVCGTPLAPDVQYCPRCGTPTPAYYASTGSSPNAPTVTPLPPPPSAPYSGAPGAAPYTDYGAQPYGTTPSSTNPYDPYTPAPPPPTVADNPYVAPPATGYGPYAPAPAPVAAPPSRPRNRLPLVIGGVILALLLIIGGLLAALLHSVGPTSTSLNPAQMTATAQAQATATFTSSLTATAQASSNATATVIAANPDPYPPGNGQLALLDPMSDNSKGYDWDTGTFSNGSCTFSGGTYHVSPAKTNFFYLCAAKASNFSNFTFEVQMDIVQGDCGGIVFRADSTNGKFYFFDVCQDGSYRLYMYPDYSGTTSKELAGGSSPAIKTGLNQSQLIAAVAQGSSITLYMNKQKVTSVTDSTFSQGQIGVVADAGNDLTEVVFSNARVWKL